MTILFFVRRFYPLIGGVEKHVMEVGKKLVLQGYRVVVVTEAVEGKGKSVKGKELINKIEVVRIPVGRGDKFKKFRIWKSLWGLRELIRQADVIHCHDVFFWYSPFRFLYPRKPVYTTFHGYESYPIRRRARLIRKISEKLSWGNICIGDFIKKWYGTNPTYVSYGAVESPISNSQFPIFNKRKATALFFGRLDEHTGVLEYVKAVDILKKKYPEFELLVVGEGEYKGLIGKKVKVTGFEKNPEKHFKNYRFAFVSRYLSILEAFASKRLVIAVYDNPVKEDYLRMAPYAKWIIIENKPEMIAKRIEELLANPEKEQKMIEDAYKWAKKQSWEEMVRLYLKLWKR
jgi:glycosyltransferase involved in cell wall biosynthesis